MCFNALREILVAVHRQLVRGIISFNGDVVEWRNLNVAVQREIDIGMFVEFASARATPFETRCAKIVSLLLVTMLFLYGSYWLRVSSHVWQMSPRL
jgi:hypothetical protein